MGSDKSCMSAERRLFTIKLIHNDFFNVRFDGLKNTKTWSKSRHSKPVSNYLKVLQFLSSVDKFPQNTSARVFVFNDR